MGNCTLEPAGASHDARSLLFSIGIALDAATHMSGNRDLDNLKKEWYKLVLPVEEAHGLYTKFRNSEKQPRNAEKTLVEYRRLVGRRDKKILPFLAKLKRFKQQNKGKLKPNAMQTVEKAIERIGQYKKEFPANQLGRKINILMGPRDLNKFIKKFSRQELVDREGNSVKVLFRGKDVGLVKFDGKLLRRSLDNLVTDALNHTPGRPIFVTLSKRNGHVAINVTNRGPKLKPSEIAKIGQVRFTRAWHDQKRGYGKISTRLLTEAQGGTFKAGNSKIGPMLTITLPRRTRRR